MTQEKLLKIFFVDMETILMLIYFNNECLLYNDILVILLCHIGWQLVQLGITALLFAACCLEIVDYGGCASGI